jgi:hypothetical protein
MKSYESVHAPRGNQCTMGLFFYCQQASADVDVSIQCTSSVKSQTSSGGFPFPPCSCFRFVKAKKNWHLVFGLLSSRCLLSITLLYSYCIHSLSGRKAERYHSLRHFGDTIEYSTVLQKYDYKVQSVSYFTLQSGSDRTVSLSVSTRDYGTVRRYDQQRTRPLTNIYTIYKATS